jgi:hypothetical protein
LNSCTQIDANSRITEWVTKVAKKYLKPSYEKVDLVGEQKVKSSEFIQHLALPCPKSRQDRAQLVANLVRVYGKDGLSIVFTQVLLVPQLQVFVSTLLSRL